MCLLTISEEDVGCTDWTSRFKVLGMLRREVGSVTIWSLLVNGESEGQVFGANLIEIAKPDKLAIAGVAGDRQIRKLGGDAGTSPVEIA